MTIIMITDLPTKRIILSTIAVTDISHTVYLQDGGTVYLSVFSLIFLLSTSFW